MESRRCDFDACSEMIADLLTQNMALMEVARLAESYGELYPPDPPRNDIASGVAARLFAYERLVRDARAALRQIGARPKAR